MACQLLHENGNSQLDRQMSQPLEMMSIKGQNTEKTLWDVEGVVATAQHQGATCCFNLQHREEIRPFRSTQGKIDSNRLNEQCNNRQAGTKYACSCTGAPSLLRSWAPQVPLNYNKKGATIQFSVYFNYICSPYNLPSLTLPVEPSRTS